MREKPTGRTLAELIGDLNPVIIGWRNYYRYATCSGKEFAKQDWRLYWRLKNWLGKKHGKASGRTLRCIYTEPGAGKGGSWRSGRTKLARFAETKRLRCPDRGPRIPNGWDDPDERFPQGSRQVLGSDPRPRNTLRATRGFGHAWRAGCGETRTSGLERGMKKPDPATGQGGSSLLYTERLPGSHSIPGRGVFPKIVCARGKALTSRYFKAGYGAEP